MKFCLDEAIGHQLAEVLRTIRAPGAPDIHGVRELNLGGVSDEILFGELRRVGVTAMVTRDSRILAASIRRDAWRVSGLTLFVCEGKWGNLSLFDLASRLIACWPIIVTHAQAGPQGAAWRVPVAGNGLVRLFPERLIRTNEKGL